MQDYNQHKIKKYPNGNIGNEHYYLNGEYHRIDKPAYIGYYENGNISNEHYYLLGKEITKEDFYTPGFIDSFILEHS